MTCRSRVTVQCYDLSLLLCLYFLVLDFGIRHSFTVEGRLGRPRGEADHDLFSICNKFWPSKPILRFRPRLRKTGILHSKGSEETIDPESFQMEPSSPSLGLSDAGLDSKELGTFWSRRKKSRSQTRTNIPFSSFWSRRKKSRSLPSLPFSTIIRFVTYHCWSSKHQSNLPRPDKNKRTIYWSKRNKPSLLKHSQAF